MNPQLHDPIEDALQTYPLAKTPPDLSRRVMRQVNAVAASSQVRLARMDIRFRLTWIDYALGFFLALLPVIGFVTWSAVPGLAWLRLAFQWQVLQTISLQPEILVALGVAGIFLFLGFLFSMDFILHPRVIRG